VITGVDFIARHDKLRDGIIFNVIKILFCKTEYLGFKNYTCAKCSNTRSVAFTCKGRFCSSCGKKQTDRWISKTINVLPKTRWQHITFTMPDSLWPIFWFNRFLFNLISAIASGIIQELAAKKGVVVGIFTALHTFGRDLKRNVHIHLSVTCGGLDAQNEWKKVYFPSEVIKKMWRHRIIDLFRNEYKNSNLTLPFCYSDVRDFNSWMRELYSIKWYVYLQAPSDNHKRNIEYLGRYIKRPPISEARIEKYDGKEVTFKFLDHYNNTVNHITMSVFKFIACLIMHIPDRNFRMIRYYGFLSNRTRGKMLPLVYKVIKQGMPKIMKVIGWRLMIWLSCRKDPLSCPNCDIPMQLSKVYYGLSPPLLMIRINEILGSLR
jgi:hypothetical protein